MTRSSDSPFPLSIFRDKTFQAREIRRVIALSLAYLLITTVLLGVFYQQMLGQLLQGAAPLFFVSEDMQLANEAIPAMTAVLGKWMLAMLAVNVIITIALGIYITRRLGQPLMAIKRSLREIGAGNLDVRLRTSDSKDFGEIADELSVALSSIRRQIGAAKSELDLVDQPETKAEDIEQVLRNCRQALDYFQVNDSASNDSKAA